MKTIIVSLLFIFTPLAYANSKSSLPDSFLTSLDRFVDFQTGTPAIQELTTVRLDGKTQYVLTCIPTDLAKILYIDKIEGSSPRTRVAEVIQNRHNDCLLLFSKLRASLSNGKRVWFSLSDVIEDEGVEIYSNIEIRTDIGLSE